MSRKFIASILAASLTITAMAAAPARASEEDLAKFLFGATALVILGKALQNRDRDSSPPVVVAPPRPHRNALPRRCLTRAETAFGATRVFRARCLQRHYRRADRLPNACRLPIWTDRGRRPAFLARCLKERGFTVARR